MQAILALIARCCPRPLAAAVLAVPGLAMAQDPLPAWYVGLMGGGVIPDSSRATENGTNGQLVVGRLLNEVVALELNAFQQRTRREIDDEEESSTGVGLDLVLGSVESGSPFFMLGGGTVREEIGAATTRSSYGNLGLGLYLPFSIGGELWRVEARYNAVFNDEAAPPSDLLEDQRFNVGIVFGFGELEPARSGELEYVTPPPAAAAERQPEPVADQDDDGVPDTFDQCPDTPRWVRPDARGCPPDNDGDGVDVTRDLCPQTPPGRTVDAHGCEPAAPGDQDGDGVSDDADRCPHSPTGYPVDAKGCIVVESVVIRNVLFPVDYYALTPEAYRLLNAVAANLHADPERRIEIGGHADSTGDAAYNQTLSLRRAEVVRDFLLYLGVAADRMEPRGYGETQPVADNRTEAGRAENRRVTFQGFVGN